MKQAEVLDRLKNDEDYYGDFGKRYLSNSDIGTLFKNPMDLGKPNEKTIPMLVGGYLHTCILEPEKLNKFKVVEANSRNNNKYKEISQGELILLQHEVDKIELLRDVILENDICRDLIQADNNEYEKPGITELFGNLWKGKADIVNHNERLIVDIKTTSDIDGFKWSAKKYNYDSQAYIYRHIFGYEFIFIAIDKTSYKINIFECSDQFYLNGEDKVQKASHIYDLFYKTDGFDPKQYLETNIL
jgi:hypothetical protein